MESIKSRTKKSSKTLEDLNMKFLKRAEKVIAFNLQTSDFTSIEHKKEIQHLITKNFFPGFDTSKTLKSVNKTKLNALIKELKSIDVGQFEKLHTYPLSGVGPGEATLYYLLDNGHLAGGGSKGVDLIVGDKKYEIKAVKKHKKEDIYYDFRLGGTVRLDDIMGELAVIKKKLALPGTSSEIPTSQIAEIKKRVPEDYAKIEKKYGDRAYKYFKDDEIILINHGGNKKDLGDIVYVGKIGRDNVGLERVTSNTIKPTFKFN